MTPLIVADDFSGACDAAARAATHGCAATALLGLPLEDRGADLLALSTESRHLSGEAARARLRGLDLAGRILYKKIDSTLRGPWIEEVDELLQITGYSQALVCPAFPALGRTVRGGWLYVDGRLTQQIVCPFTVRDASTEEDLARIVLETCSSILPVGSAGLARHFFGAFDPSPARHRRPIGPIAGPWIVLIGSEHPASMAQLRFLREHPREELLLNPETWPEACAGVFATGGETAARFLRSTEARGITELRELLPGVPAGRILGGSYNGAVMITKAGGFGAPDTVLRAIGGLRSG